MDQLLLIRDERCDVGEEILRLSHALGVRGSSAVLTTRKLDRIEALEATRPVHLPTAEEESHSGELCCA